MKLPDLIISSTRALPVLWLSVNAYNVFIADVKQMCQIVKKRLRFLGRRYSGYRNITKIGVVYCWL